MRAPEEMLIEGTKGWHALVVPGSVGHQDIITSACCFCKHLYGDGGAKKRLKALRDAVGKNSGMAGTV